MSYCLVTVKPLLWRHLYSRDTSFQGTQIFAQKNVEIICVQVTSNPNILTSIQSHLRLRKLKNFNA